MILKKMRLSLEENKKRDTRKYQREINLKIILEKRKEAKKKFKKERKNENELKILYKKRRLKKHFK